MLFQCAFLQLSDEHQIGHHVGGPEVRRCYGVCFLAGAKFVISPDAILTDPRAHPDSYVRVQGPLSVPGKVVIKVNLCNYTPS
jgi:hypothetical protein